MVYNAKRAIADFGFIESYSRHASLPGNDIWFEAFIEALSRVEDFLRKGSLLTGTASPEGLSGFLYDVGFVRGSIWNDKIPYAVSEALANLVNFVTEHEGWHTDRPEPKEEMLSDHARDSLLTGASEGRCLFRLGLSGEVDATQEAVVRYTAQELGAADHGEAKQWSEEARREWEAEKQSQPQEPTAGDTSPGAAPSIADAESDEKAAEPVPAVKPSNPTGKRGTREWTPEQRAAQAERAKGRKKPPFDDDLESVKADFDAGMSLGEIGRKWRCSDGHIRNFLTRHGIDPRRNPPGTRAGGRPPLSEMQVNTIIEEKAKGTPSKKIAEMIDRSQHAVDVKYGELKKEGRVPEEHLSLEAIGERKAAANAQRAESMREYHAQRHEDDDAEDDAVTGDQVDEDDVDIADDSRVESEADLASLRITVPHPRKRDYGQLHDDDWPDIKEMLAKGTERRIIASDFDVDPEDLDFFIASCQRREAKQPPGEAHAPL